MDANAGKVLVDGNSAAALGACFAGVSVVSWYPITPSSSLGESLAGYLEKYRIDEASGKATFAVIQAEDELAAIGMALGAGWAGARSLTTTSGPGISLMGELAGFGYYALVWQTLVSGFANAVLRIAFARFRPRLVFDRAALRGVGTYSSGVTAFTAINYWARNLDKALIGRALGAAQLGFYGRAYALMLYPLEAINGIINPSLHPLFSAMQDDLARMTRPEEGRLPTELRDKVQYGAGPRASIALLMAGKARALLHKRCHVTTDDIYAVAPPVMRHRIIPTFNAEAAGMDTDGIVKTLVDRVRAAAR